MSIILLPPRGLPRLLSVPGEHFPALYDPVATVRQDCLVGLMIHGDDRGV